MELLQFHTLLYLALEEVRVVFDAPPALPREKAPLFVGYGARRVHKARLEALKTDNFFYL